MTDTAILTEKDRNLGIAIHLALSQGMITEKINGNLVTYFQGLQREDRRRFYEALSDHEYATATRDAARSIVNAHVNSLAAFMSPDPKMMNKLENRARMNVEECRLALRKLGIEW